MRQWDARLCLRLLGHAGLGALIAVLACLVWAFLRPDLASSMRDPAVAWTLLLSIAAILSANSGITAYILIKIDE